VACWLVASLACFVYVIWWPLFNSQATLLIWSAHTVSLVRCGRPHRSFCQFRRTTWTLLLQYSGTRILWTVELLHLLTHLRSGLRHFSLLRHNPHCSTRLCTMARYKCIDWLIDRLYGILSSPALMVVMDESLHSVMISCAVQHFDTVSGNTSTCQCSATHVWLLVGWLAVMAACLWYAGEKMSTLHEWVTCDMACTVAHIALPLLCLSSFWSSYRPRTSNVSEAEHKANWLEHVTCIYQSLNLEENNLCQFLVCVLWDYFLVCSRGFSSVFAPCGAGAPSSPLVHLSPVLLFLSFIGFTYFLLLSIPSLSTRIVPLCFQAGGPRRRLNLGLVCIFCVFYLCYLYSLVKMHCSVFFLFGLVTLVMCVPSVLWHCWLGHLTRKNPSPIWPIMCLVGC